jgi:hypothetical protein
MYFVAFLLGTAFGAVVMYWRGKSKIHARRRIPREWPLKVRTLVNSRERKVWIWLARVMFDQQILVKLPVTRFTAPAARDDASHWYELLNGVYCTFTVSTMDGKVIGCIDVPGLKGLSMSNQSLKHSLLSQCGIRYWVVDPHKLPHLADIRTAFLGEQAVVGSERDVLHTRFKDVSENLQAAVTRQRHSKSSHFARLDADIQN